MLFLLYSPGVILVQGNSILHASISYFKSILQDQENYSSLSNPWLIFLISFLASLPEVVPVCAIDRMILYDVYEMF